MSAIGPKAKRRRHIHLIRLAIWLAQVPLVYWWKPELRNAVSYVVAISIAAGIEGAWSSYAADSPVDE